MNSNPFDARGTFDVGGRKVGIYRLSALEQAGVAKIDSLPYSIRVLLESALRNVDGFIVSEADVRRIASWNPTSLPEQEIPFLPARVVLQDFTGVPAVVDLAAMREAMSRLGGDPKKINPLIPVDLVIDHSVQVDRFGTPESLEQNVEIEFERNLERYEFLRWGQKAFANFRVVPPNTGIVHQVNLEYLAKCVFLGQDKHAKDAEGEVAYPDSLVGTDSHTTMINGLGVVGWGVGGIEAEGVMLGQPIYMLLPEVVGFRLSGAFRPGATATDLVLTVTQILRKEGVVNKFVEFFGPGVSKMTLADRATIGNMAPEYGATIGFFPVDAETLRYMHNTGRTKDEVALVEAYCKEQGLFRTDDAPEPQFTKILSLDLADVEPSMAGPKRPQDRVPLSKMKSSFQRALSAPIAERGFALDSTALARTAIVEQEPNASTIGHGAVVIAAITSCTNTSNPSVMMAAGILAKKAVAKGLSVKPYVKTSLAPGSRVVTAYYEKAGVMDALDQLGFNVVGYGCTTCIGNSGPLPDEVASAVKEGDLVAAAVLSGNRNFEGRVNPLTRANYLASPPLVVAYALAGTVDIDFESEPVGYGDQGAPVFLKDIWPTHEEVQTLVRDSVLAEQFLKEYGQVFDGNPMWNEIKISGGELYDWQADSTYIQNPPFLADLTVAIKPVPPIRGARVLLALGDSVTTDHISPAGAISKDSPAGRFLQASGVPPLDFNSYGSRRGNDRVMVRGTFANIRIRNAIGQGKEGGWTTHFPDGELLSVYDAAMKYIGEGVQLVILAGAEYGTGSSRDWAAKGTFQLGVRAVIAASYERIHRSNLVMMGVLPLQFASGETWESVGLTGSEVFDIPVADDLKPGSIVTVTATNEQGVAKTFDAIARIDTLVELDYYRNGGILQTVLRKLLKS